MTEQQKKAVEAVIKWEVGKQYPLDFGMTGQQKLNASNLRAAFEDGLRSVLNNPEKYGLQPINEWVSVKDRLPCESGRYWCYVQEQNDLGTSHFQWNCYFANDTKEFSDQFERYNVIHWQPLPQPPINEREEG